MDEGGRAFKDQTSLTAVKLLRRQEGRGGRGSRKSQKFDSGPQYGGLSMSTVSILRCVLIT